MADFWHALNAHWEFIVIVVALAGVSHQIARIADDVHRMRVAAEEMVGHARNRANGFRG